MDIDVVRPNYEDWNLHVESVVEKICSEIFMQKPFARAMKSLETLKNKIGTCRTVKELRHYIETSLNLESEDGEDFYKEVLDGLSENANLRNIKDGEFIVRIADLNTESEIQSIVNSGTDKRYRRFMIKGASSVYYLDANKVISVDLLSKFWGLLSIKVMNEFREELKLRLKDSFPVVEYLKKMKIGRRFETLQRYVFNKQFNEYEKEVMNEIDLYMSKEFKSIFSSVLLINRHLSYKVNSERLQNFKISLFFPDNGVFIEKGRVLGVNGNYYYQDIRYKDLYLLPSNVDCLVFERKLFKQLDDIAMSIANRFFYDLIEALLSKLTKYRIKGIQVPDFEVKTVVKI